jgi:hypothetical protein
MYPVWNIDLTVGKNGINTIGCIILGKQRFNRITITFSMSYTSDLEYTLSVADICISVFVLAIISSVFLAGVFITIWNFRYPDLGLSKPLSIFTCLGTLFAAFIGIGLLINGITESALYLQSYLNPESTSVNELIYQIFGIIILYLWLMFMAIVHCYSIMEQCKKYVSRKRVKICQMTLIISTLILMVPTSIVKFVLHLVITVKGRFVGALGTATNTVDMLYDCLLIVICFELFLFSLVFGGLYIHRKSSSKKILLPWEMIWAFLIFSIIRISSNFVTYGFSLIRVEYPFKLQISRVWTFNLVWLTLSLLLLNHVIIMSPTVNHRVPGVIRRASPETRELLDQYGSSLLVARQRHSASSNGSMAPSDLSETKNKTKA